MAYVPQMFSHTPPEFPQSLTYVLFLTRACDQINHSRAMTIDRMKDAVLLIHDAAGKGTACTNKITGNTATTTMPTLDLSL